MDKLLTLVFTAINVFTFWSFYVKGNVSGMVFVAVCFALTLFGGRIISKS